jgi:hypothetical protein
MTFPEASFLKVSLRLHGKLAPTQRWHLAELAPTGKLAPTRELAPTGKLAPTRELASMRELAPTLV